MATSENLRRKKALAAKRRKARPRKGRVRHRAAPPEFDEGPLDRVAFGSTRAKERAEEPPSLTWLDFAESSVVPSGEEGYLVEDVREVREQRDERLAAAEDEEE